MNEEIKLTQYSHGSGCGCKIAPAALEEILSGIKSTSKIQNLLVGNESADDAAVLKLNNDTALISTTDFFMPVVDDAFDFGCIAAANAISDVYAMGGKPIMALAIFGWPIEKLSASLAAKVLAGGKSICELAGIPLAGGHTIDSPEPIFGLSVNGIIHPSRIKKNNTAQAGDILFLTKPIGTGIITTAVKRNKCSPEILSAAIHQMKSLNSVGEIISEYDFVNAMTDVTGFGLLGHLLEMCEGSKLNAELFYDKIKLMNGVSELVKQFIYPDNTMRNWKSYESKVEGIGAESLLTLCDPQTSGGLLIAVEEKFINEFQQLMNNNNLANFISPIGKLKSTQQEKIIKIIS